jgi:hypothetical protein
MVVNQVHIKGIAVSVSENNSPVPGNLNRPKAFQVTLQRVQTKAGRIHVLYCQSRIQACENAPDFSQIPRLDTASVSAIKETFKSAMSEAYDHE